MNDDVGDGDEWWCWWWWWMMMLVTVMNDDVGDGDEWWCWWWWWMMMLVMVIDDDVGDGYEWWWWWWWWMTMLVISLDIPQFDHPHYAVWRPECSKSFFLRTFGFFFIRNVTEFYDWCRRFFPLFGSITQLDIICFGGALSWMFWPSTIIWVQD